MDVNVMVFEEILTDLQFERVGAHPRESSLHGFLHDLSKLAGHGEAAFAFHLVGFHEQHIATGGSPSQAHGNSGALGALGNLGVQANLDRSEERRVGEESSTAAAHT